MDVAISVNGVPIRRTAERWMHIVENRDKLAGRSDAVLDAVEQPDWVTRSYGGSLVAWKGFGRKRYLAVIYKEVSRSDGFVITAFLTANAKKKNKLWP